MSQEVGASAEAEPELDQDVQELSPAEQRRRRRLRRSLWTWLIVVVLLISAGGTALNWFMVDRDPEEPVEDWLDAMVDGRSRQALALFGDSRGGTGAESMPNAAYRQAEGRISSWEIVDVQRDGDRAQVTASVRWPDGQVPEGAEHGEEHTWSVHQVRRTGPLNDSWEMDGVDASTLTVAAPGIRALSINGERIGLDSEDRTVADGAGGKWQWEALPGRFAVDLPEGDDYVLAEPIDPAEVLLGDPQPQEVVVELEPSPQLWAEVDQEIVRSVESCMDSTSVSPDACPASRRWAEGGVPRADAADNAEIEVPESGLKAPKAGAEISEVEWELVSRPPLWMVAEEDSDSQLDWVADETAQAEARLSYLEDGKRVEEIVSFPVHVDVTSDGRDAEIDVALR